MRWCDKGTFVQAAARAAGEVLSEAGRQQRPGRGWRGRGWRARETCPVERRRGQAEEQQARGRSPMCRRLSSAPRSPPLASYAPWPPRLDVESKRAQTSCSPEACVQRQIMPQAAPSPGSFGQPDTRAALAGHIISVLSPTWCSAFGRIHRNRRLHASENVGRGCRRRRRRCAVRFRLGQLLVHAPQRLCALRRIHRDGLLHASKQVCRWCCWRRRIVDGRKRTRSRKGRTARDQERRARASQVMRA